MTMIDVREAREGDQQFVPVLDTMTKTYVQGVLDAADFEELIQFVDMRRVHVSKHKNSAGDGWCWPYLPHKAATDPTHPRLAGFRERRTNIPLPHLILGCVHSRRISPRSDSHLDVRRSNLRPCHSSRLPAVLSDLSPNVPPAISGIPAGLRPPSQLLQTAHPQLQMVMPTTLTPVRQLPRCEIITQHRPVYVVLVNGDEIGHFEDEQAAKYRLAEHLLEIR